MESESLELNVVIELFTEKKVVTAEGTEVPAIIKVGNGERGKKRAVNLVPVVIKFPRRRAS